MIEIMLLWCSIAEPQNCHKETFIVFGNALPYTCASNALSYAVDNNKPNYKISKFTCKPVEIAYGK